jgi:hypothetical protein
VQVYNNGVMVGSVMCTNGSFSLQVSLFSGSNDLTASVFDDLDQTGPKSNITTVNYNNATFVAFSQQVQLTSPYGRRGATPGTTLTWPLQLTGGVGSYALSIDWGDGTAPELKSVASGGQFDISHVYKKAGIYNVIVKATDSTGATGFLQLVALGTGNINAANSTANPNTTQTAATSSGAIMLLPAAVSFLMLGPAFVLGRMSMPKRH